MGGMRRRLGGSAKRLKQLVCDGAGEGAGLFEGSGGSRVSTWWLNKCRKHDARLSLQALSRPAQRLAVAQRWGDRFGEDICTLELSQRRAALMPRLSSHG